MIMYTLAKLSLFIIVNLPRNWTKKPTNNQQQKKTTKQTIKKTKQKTNQKNTVLILGYYDGDLGEYYDLILYMILFKLSSNIDNTLVYFLTYFSSYFIEMRVPNMIFPLC